MRVARYSNNRKHVSPLRYPGGKTCLVPLFEKVLQKSPTKTTYVEPYAGGAGAALALLYSGKVKRIVINDLDRAIYAFWWAATKRSEAFVAKMRKTRVSVAEWRRQKLIYQNKKATLFDLGFATFFLNRTNVSGIMDGGPIGGLDQTGKYKITARYNKKMLVRRLEQLGSHAPQITVTNDDGVHLIKKYLRQKKAFIYLDPPYLDKGYSLYMNSYKIAEHDDLAEVLNRNAKAFWLLTYDSKHRIKKRYPKRRVVEFVLDYRAYKARKGKEVLISADAVKFKLGAGS
jgi:DNA adenine methylase